MPPALSLPAARAAPNLTLLVWGGITVLGSLLLPWFREGRDLFVAVPHTRGLDLLAQSWVMGAILLLGLLTVATGLVPRSNVQRGRAALDGVGDPLGSPGFFLLNNPGTPRNETALAVAWGAGIGLAAALWLFASGRRWRGLRWGGAAGGGGGVLAALYPGHRALGDSVVLGTG